MEACMRTRVFLLLASASLVFALLFTESDSLQGQPPTSAALTGRVSSKEEGPMEGVLVSAKKADSTIAVTVASDKQGHYSFPANRLDPGQYSLRIRAAGYDLESPNAVEITAQKTA